MNEILQQRIEEAARHYLLNEHVSPLNDVMHQADLKAEIQYHKDIENAFIAGIEWYAKNQWISVDERLPEKEGRYLCNYHYKMTNSQDECDCVDFVLFKDGKWYVANDEVTHWTEIPQLPKEEEK